STPYKPCQKNLSMNFYLAGMRTRTTYAVNHIVNKDSELVDGPVLSLSTPDVSLPIGSYNVLQPLQTPTNREILLQSTPFQYPVATDLQGNLLWFYQVDISIITRPEPGGFLFGLLETAFTDPSHQVFRKFDLTGSTILVTNAARVNEQLTVLGKRHSNECHPEVRSRPHG